MPAIGGTKIPLPREQLDKAKTLYLEGKPWDEIAQLTGLNADSLRVKASVCKWTEIKAEAKAKAELSGLRPKLHGKLSTLVNQVKVPQTANVKRLRPIVDLLSVATSTAKDLEGWQDVQSNTLVNIAVLSSATHDEPVPVIDCTVPEEKACLNPVPEQPSEG